MHLQERVRWCGTTAMFVIDGCLFHLLSEQNPNMSFGTAACQLLSQAYWLLAGFGVLTFMMPALLSSSRSGDARDSMVLKAPLPVLRAAIRLLPLAALVWLVLTESVPASGTESVNERFTLQKLGVLKMHSTIFGPDNAYSPFHVRLAALDMAPYAKRVYDEDHLSFARSRIEVPLQEQLELARESIVGIENCRDYLRDLGQFNELTRNEKGAIAAYSHPGLENDLFAYYLYTGNFEQAKKVPNTLQLRRRTKDQKGAAYNNALLCGLAKIMPEVRQNVGPIGCAGTSSSVVVQSFTAVSPAKDKLIQKSAGAVGISLH